MEENSPRQTTSSQSSQNPVEIQPSEPDKVETKSSFWKNKWLWIGVLIVAILVPTTIFAASKIIQKPETSPTPIPTATPTPTPQTSSTPISSPSATPSTKISNVQALENIKYTLPTN